MTSQRPSEEAFATARQMSERGNTRGMIVLKLQDQGLDLETAQEIADQALGRQKNAERGKGAGQLLIGAIVVVIGLSLFWFSSNSKQGTVLPWGMLGFGIMNLFMGAVRMVSGQNPE